MLADRCYFFLNTYLTEIDATFGINNDAAGAKKVSEKLQTQTALDRHRR